MSEELQDVTSDDVVNFVRGSAKKGGFFSDNEVLIDNSQLDKEDLEAITSSPEAAKEAEFIESPTHHDFDKDVPTVSNHITFEEKLPDLGTIDVTDLEKDLYIKALLNDTTFRLTVEPFDTVKITVRSRTMGEEDFIYQCLKTEREKGEIIGIEGYYTRLQYYIASFQVEKFGNTSMLFQRPTGNFTAQHKALKKHVDDTYGNVHRVKWNAITMAVRMFDAKEKICNDNLRKQNFWPTAGIS
jgi:hypothetical protein